MPVKKEEFSLSFDASTSVVGWTLWNSKGKMVEMDFISLKKVSKDLSPEDREIAKSDLFKEWIVAFKKEKEEKYNCKIINVFIEEPIGGSTNVNTVNMLFSFNGILRYILHEVFNIIVIKISVYDSRKIFCPELVTVKNDKKGKTKETLSFPSEWVDRKKEYIFCKVKALEPNYEWKLKKHKDQVIDESFDVSDSYCVGYSSLKILGIL